MYRVLCAISIVAGALFAVAFPHAGFGAPTGYTIVASMTPPTLSSGSSPLLTCGWHAACVSPWSSGVGLDWDDGSSGYGNPWYFRGYFATDNPAQGIVATGQPMVNLQHPDYCDRMTVFIMEKYGNVLRAAPVYTHTNITNSNAFNIQGSVLGTYISRQIGTTINDQGTNCPFGGSHVHEEHAVISGPVTISRNTGKYPTASACHTSCGTFKNNNLSNWTRRFSWPEGG